jgi:3-deoxy-manno-octulosonate cytidylyltransferase (CMP-KDO synthetase)
VKIIGIIPARYASTRFPGKPLIDIAGKSMIQRVFEQAKKSTCLAEVIVATDDARIKQHVKAFGGNVIMTAETHQSGTDRCFEAIQKYNDNADVVINIQGDEPFIQPQQIDLLAACFNSNDVQLATLIKKVSNNEELFNVNTPKVIIDKNGNAIYFSRQTIPYIREKQTNDWLANHTFYKHIGIYGYTIKALSEITVLQPSALERAEGLEQLRWIENGYKIKVNLTDFESVAIDVPDDLKKLTKFL